MLGDSILTVVAYKEKTPWKKDLIIAHIMQYIQNDVGVHNDPIPVYLK